MGWLELLPLLRRVLPLLDRLAPMLESLLAGRMGARTAEADRTQAAVASLSESHTGLQNALQTQSDAIQALAGQVHHLEAAIDALHSRLAAADSRVAAVSKTLRIAFTAIFLLLLACITFVLALLLRRN